MLSLKLIVSLFAKLGYSKGEDDNNEYLFDLHRKHVQKPDGGGDSSF